MRAQVGQAPHCWPSCFPPRLQRGLALPGVECPQGQPGRDWVDPRPRWWSWTRPSLAGPAATLGRCGPWQTPGLGGGGCGQASHLWRISGAGIPRNQANHFRLSGVQKCRFFGRRCWFNKLCTCLPRPPPRTPRSRTSHSAPPAPRQSGRRPVSAGTCAAPTWALHPPARVRGDGRAAEEAEAESALGRALHRQRHHRAASVHGLPAHPDPVLLPRLAVSEPQPVVCVGECRGSGGPPPRAAPRHVLAGDGGQELPRRGLGALGPRRHLGRAEELAGAQARQQSRRPGRARGSCGPRARGGRACRGRGPGQWGTGVSGAWGTVVRGGARGRGRDRGARGSHPELPGPTRASRTRPSRGSRGWHRCSRALAPGWASGSWKRSMDQSVLSSKAFETWVTQCGAWCLLRTSPLGLSRSVTQPRLDWKWTVPRPGDEGRCFWVLPGPSPHTVTWCCGASSVCGGKRYMRTGKSLRSCCSAKPPRSAVSSSDSLTMRTDFSRRLTAAIFRQEPGGLHWCPGRQLSESVLQAGTVLPVLSKSVSC